MADRRGTVVRGLPLLKKGDFFNTVTGDYFGPSVKIVPLLKFGNRIRFQDMDKGGGILCRSDDMIHGVGDNPVDGNCAKCPYAQFGSARGGEGKGTACSEFMNFPALVLREGKVDIKNTVIWSAKSSHIDAAKQLVGLAMRRRLASGMRAPMWSGVYTLTTKIKKFTEKLSAYVVAVDNAGWIPGNQAEMVKSAFDFILLHPPPPLRVPPYPLRCPVSQYSLAAREPGELLVSRLPAERLVGVGCQTPLLAKIVHEVEGRLDHLSLIAWYPAGVIDGNDIG